MRNVHLVCGCGEEIYNLEDIICHFRYRGFKRGLVLFLKSKIVFGRNWR